jgi:hypothetical protein
VGAGIAVGTIGVMMFPRFVLAGTGAQDEIKTIINIELRRYRPELLALSLLDNFRLRFIWGFLNQTHSYILK